jgi:hypothetical protein
LILRREVEEWTAGASAGGSGKKSKKGKKGAKKKAGKAGRKGQQRRQQQEEGKGGGAQAKKAGTEDSPSPLESQADEEPPDECAICLLELEEEDEDDEGGLVLGCGHRFHAACVEQWVDRSHSKGMRATCPMCRADLTY